jgi:hypothetical protein
MIDFSKVLDQILYEAPERVGMYAIQTDHPGLMPGIKKKKTTKQDRSFLGNDADAGKQYITGTMDASGAPKGKKSKNESKIYERVSKRLENLNGD